MGARTGPASADQVWELHMLLEDKLNTARPDQITINVLGNPTFLLGNPNGHRAMVEVGRTMGQVHERHSSTHAVTVSYDTVQGNASYPEPYGSVDAATFQGIIDRLRTLSVADEPQLE